MKRKLIYIHGYGSDRNARKFVDLQNYFKDQFYFHCLEWITHSDIPYLLNKVFDKCNLLEEIVIVGDSTGANLAYQLREMRNKPNDKLVLLSPLLDAEKITVDIKFPEIFLKELVKIENPKNSLVIAAKGDEVLDQKWLFELADKNFELLEVEDNHRLEKFQNYLPEIEKFIN